MAVFKPSAHIPLSKALAAIQFPLDARSYFYDETLFVYRPYVSEAEVNGYLLGNFRIGGFDIVINFGGSLSGGVVTGGENLLYWYDIGITDADLKRKGGFDNPPIIQQNRKPIPVTGDLSIDWQTDLVPGDDLGRTYFQRYGNYIQDIRGIVSDGSGGFNTNYSPNYSYTMSGANIDTVTITEVFPGNLSII